MKQALIFALFYTPALLSMQSNEPLIPTEAIVGRTKKSHPDERLFSPSVQNKPTISKQAQATKGHTNTSQKSARATLLLGAWTRLLHGPEYGYYD